MLCTRNVVKCLARTNVVLYGMHVNCRKKISPLNYLLICSYFFFSSISSATNIDSFDDTEPDDSSTILMDISGDKVSGTDYFLSASTMMDENHELYFSTATQNNSEDYATRSYSITVEDQADTRFNSGFGLEWWGKKGDITTRSVTAILRYNQDNFSFSLSPKIQRITVNIPRGRFNVSSDGWSATFSYFFPRNWFISLRTNNNKFYNSNNFQLRNLDVRSGSNRYQTLFSAPLDLYRNSVTFGTQYEIFDITMDYTKSKYVIARSISTFMSASLSFPVTKTMSANGQVGKFVTTGESDSLLVYSGGISVRF